MEKVSRSKKIFSVGALIVLSACASKILDEKEIDDFQKSNNEEFSEVVKIKTLPQKEEGGKNAAKDVVSKKPKIAEPPKEKVVITQKKTKVEDIKPPPKEKVKEKRRPGHEDSEGFNGRRPLVDPFVVGEKVTLAMKYFKMAAGYLTMETRPMVEVNGNKAYHFAAALKTSKVFSWVYEVDDWSETFLDYETLLPHTMSIHVNETKQVKEIRTFFDHKTRKAKYWEKKVTKKNGARTRTKSWKTKPFSQNVFSIIYYLRAFQLKPGKKLKFYVADDGKNLLFTFNVLRREKLETEVGTLDTLVLKPSFKVDGIFKPVGDIFIWLTDDDYKTLVRLESKIKIGTIIGELTALERN